MSFLDNLKALFGSTPSQAEGSTMDESMDTPQEPQNDQPAEMPMESGSEESSDDMEESSDDMDDMGGEMNNDQ